MWGNGGDADMIPEPHFRVHYWEDKGEWGPYFQTMHSIHMAKTEIRWKDCPANDGSMIIPCAPLNRRYNASTNREYCSPLGGKVMNAWLSAHPIKSDLKEWDTNYTNTRRYRDWNYYNRSRSFLVA